MSDGKGGRVVSSLQSTGVFVVGAGPAGLATATAARKRGLEVVVADGAESRQSTKPAAKD